MSPEEIPTGESFDFVLVPAKPESEAAESEDAKTGETTPEKKEESKGMVVYCMDISGSMACTLRLPELQGTIIKHIAFTTVISTVFIELFTQATILLTGTNWKYLHTRKLM